MISISNSDRATARPSHRQQTHNAHAARPSPDARETTAQNREHANHAAQRARRMEFAEKPIVRRFQPKILQAS